MDPVSTLAAHSADGGAALATPATEPDEPARVLLPMPVYVRSVSRTISGAILMLSILSGVGTSAYLLSDDASKLIELLPVAAQKLRDSIRTIPGRPDSPLATVQKAATELEQAAEETTHGPPVSRGVQRVQIEKPKFDVKDHLWSGTLGLFDDLKPVGEFLGA